MIANVEFNNPKKGAIRTYAKYMMSPKDQAMPLNHSGHTAGNERLEAVYCSGLTPFDAQKGQRSINKSCKLFEEEMRAWNKTWKQGQKIKDTSNQCVLGTISFGENDKITVEDAMAKAQEVVRNVMPGTRLALFTVHGDSNVFHVHFEVSVVDMETGKAYAPQGEYRAMYNQWELELERMELAYPDQLEHVQQREAVAIQERKAGIETTRGVNIKQLTHKTHQKLFKRGVDIEDVPEADLRQQFTLAYRESGKDFDKLLDNLEARGIQVIPNMGQNVEKINGLTIAFKHDLSIRTATGKYGDKYKWSNLSKEFNYDNAQQRGRLIECKAEAEALKHGRPQTTGMDGQDSRASEQLDHRATSEAHGPDTRTGRNEEASQVEPDGQGHAGRTDRTTPHLGQDIESTDRSNKHTDRQSAGADGPTTRETGPFDHTSEGTGRGITQGDESTAEGPHSVALHRSGGIDNTNVLTGVSNPNLATEQGHTQGVVLSDDTTAQSPEPLSIVELIEQHQALAEELVDLQGRAERGNLTDYWDPYTKQTLGEKIEQVQAAYDANLAQIEAEPVMVPADSTINNVYYMGDDQEHNIHKGEELTR